MKNSANFFKFFLRILEKLQKKNLFIVSFSFEKSVNIFLPVLYEKFHVREKVLC